jgi:superfamily II DNA or RNA helicase
MRSAQNSSSDSSGTCKDREEEANRKTAAGGADAGAPESFMVLKRLRRANQAGGVGRPTGTRYIQKNNTPVIRTGSGQGGGMGSLLSSLKSAIGSSELRKGQDYFFRQRVHDLRIGEDCARADVKGSASEPYQVTLAWRTGLDAVDAWCTCPRFGDEGCCKHFAAVVLALDRQVSPPAGAAKRLAIQPKDDLEELGEDEFDRGHSGERVSELQALADEVGVSLEDVQDFATANLAGPEGMTSLGELLGRRGKAARRAAPPAKATPAPWRAQLETMRHLGPTLKHYLADPPAPRARERQLRLRIYLDDCARRKALVVRLFVCEAKKNNAGLGKPKPAHLERGHLEQFSDPQDRNLLSLLVGNECFDLRYDSFGYAYGSYGTRTTFTSISIAPERYEELLPLLCARGRTEWAQDDSSARSGSVYPLSWDVGPAWRCRVHVAPTKASAWELTGQFERPGETSSIAAADFLWGNGLILMDHKLARLELTPDVVWIDTLKRHPVVTIPKAEADDFAEYVLTVGGKLPADAPAELRFEEAQPVLKPTAKITEPAKQDYGFHGGRLCAQVDFTYDGVAFPCANAVAHEPRIDRAHKRIVHRNPEAEQQALRVFHKAGFKSVHSYYQRADRNWFAIDRSALPAAVQQLIAAGWDVEAEGFQYKRPGALSVSVTSGVDWFDLSAEWDYGGEQVKLPRLLEAVRKGEKFIKLGDGSHGTLPEEWLKKYASILELGESSKNAEGVRYATSQALFLDMLLAAQPHVRLDKKFAHYRKQLQSFDGVTAVREPSSFQGELREYQRQGLGWLHFLQQFQLGGCLADDMGLGKTVQVLALLEQRRRARRPKGEAKRPSLAVVPRSLIYNWMEEAQRFTPALSILNYSGQERSLAGLESADLVLTTYGLMRQDIVQLKDIEFDYLILDESQAIKNANSQAAKAARLLQGKHRLAMSGTPVENHLGELWSLMEFLNPGLLGRTQSFSSLFGSSRSADGEALANLAQAIRPFVLRRTKEQVLAELPAKTEQTLFCELEPAQRELYNELRDHYRAALEARISKDGLKKSKIQVLEALLRLRQAACHPGLLDKKRGAEASAKLDTLLAQLAELTAEGHKSLVFSQFTSLLALVEERLQAEGIPYAYLDGKTRDRKSAVKKFQNEEDCKVFLLSLKAGGVGLNLTAADYVFILDPWWNPAVEAQAVDRAHRLGQSRHVFAYRLIATDTVEEKILELQRSKRDLAEAIITADENLLAKLTADDLKVLLS